MIEQSQWQVVIADRGWVYLGRCKRQEDQVVLTDCYNIRRWGTTKGLGELAKEGPKADTVLDLYGTVRIHVLAVLGFIEADDGVWNAWHATQKHPATKANKK